MCMMVWLSPPKQNLATFLFLLFCVVGNLSLGFLSKPSLLDTPDS